MDFKEGTSHRRAHRGHCVAHCVAGMYNGRTSNTSRCLADINDDIPLTRLDRRALQWQGSFYAFRSLHVWQDDKTLTCLMIPLWSQVRSVCGSTEVQMLPARECEAGYQEAASSRRTLY